MQKRGVPRMEGGGGGSEMHYVRAQNALCASGILGPIGPRFFLVFACKMLLANSIPHS